MTAHPTPTAGASASDPQTSSAPTDTRSGPGRLLLMPNALDLGGPAQPLNQVLPLGVIEQAAQLRHWAVENARSARAFLKRVHERVPLVLPLQELEIQELPRARKGSGQPVPAAEWQALLAPALAGHDLGLLSEAGLPAVADPGADLVAAAHAAGLSVIALPGPSALLMALAASGLNGQSFSFVGYLPQEPGARVARIRELETLSRKLQQTQICIETPYRNQALLGSLLETLSPQTRLSLSAGLTLQQAFSHSDTVAGWRPARAQWNDRLGDRLPAVFSWLAS